MGRDEWLRDDQKIGSTWRAYGFVAPEGWGKAQAIAAHITTLVLSCTGDDISVIAANTEGTSRAISALREAAPSWARPRVHEHSSILLWPGHVEARFRRLDAAGTCELYTSGVVWLVDLGAWADEHLETFERVRNGGYTQILWDATNGESRMVQALGDSIAENRRTVKA